MPHQPRLACRTNHGWRVVRWPHQRWRHPFGFRQLKQEREGLHCNAHNRTLCARNQRFSGHTHARDTSPPYVPVRINARTLTNGDHFTVRNSLHPAKTLHHLSQRGAPRICPLNCVPHLRTVASISLGLKINNNFALMVCIDVRPRFLIRRNQAA